MVSFFPRDIFDEIWDLIETVSEGFRIYFRREYSTIDNIMVLYSLIEYFKSNRNKLYCCIIDFTKAFDNVWRAGFWRKLLKHGINGKIITVVQNINNRLNLVSHLMAQRLVFLIVRRG